MSTKAEDTQKNILDTARKHFLKDGLTGASLRNIVKDAGLTTGAFYKYYPTKEALFDALTDPYMEHIYQIYDQIVEEFEKLSASDQTRMKRTAHISPTVSRAFLLSSTHGSSFPVRIGNTKTGYKMHPLYMLQTKSAMPPE